MLNTAGLHGGTHSDCSKKRSNYKSGVRGLANYTGAEALSDTTYGATPWGTLNTDGSGATVMMQLQFIEIGLNFSRFGMNPFQYVTSFCKSPYSSFIVKSRASTFQFDSNLEDFVVPVNLLL